MMINDYLKDNNITKYQFAKMCDLPYTTLNDICTGKTDIAKCSGITLMKIANILECTVDDLLKERCMSVLSLEKITALITPVAEKHKLRSVYIFGSYARNEADENSDIDIMIDREGSEIHGIFGMSALLNEFKTVLKKDIDLVTLQSLQQTGAGKYNAGFIENVMKEKVRIYG